jgi:hypothetical protein
MMNTTKILQNSWNLMLHYRALWLFGVILALTTVSFASPLWLTADDNPSDRTLINWEISSRDQAWIKENFGLELPLQYKLEIEDLTFRLDDPLLSPQEKSRLINITIRIFLILLAFLVVMLLFRYTARAALIKMVNDHQTNKEKYPTRKGWSLGFSTAALKMFLIDLIVYPLLFLFTILLLLAALIPVLIAIKGSPAAITIGVLLMISLTLVSVAGIIVMWIAGMITLQIARRACLIEGLGVFASIWRGIRLTRLHLRSVGTTWLILLGVDLIYPILIAPVAILLLGAGLAFSGLLAFALGSLLSLLMVKATAWTIAVITGLVLLVLIICIPITLLSGLLEVFKSSTWTLTFREGISNRNLSPSSSPQSELTQAQTSTV